MLATITMNRIVRQRRRLFDPVFKLLVGPCAVSERADGRSRVRFVLTNRIGSCFCSRITRIEANGMIIINQSAIRIPLG